MFGHLDDPGAGEPTARQIAAVYARSSAVRRRRANVRFAALGALLLVGGVLAGFFIPRSPIRLAVANLALEDRGLVTGLEVPAVHLTNAVFPDPEHGFAVTTSTRKVALVATTDGGATWTVVDPALPIDSPWTLQLDFTDPVHGYMWGGQSPGRLWITADGGRAWAKAPIGPSVFDISAIGPNVWAVSTCVISAALTNTCPISLDRSTDDGRSWTVMSQVPTMAGADAATHT
ncbi:MAG: WD40/YVTN/BNR-like repeat-containing protein, partial [Acidimicrobiales bacterium]